MSFGWLLKGIRCSSFIRMTRFFLLSTDLLFNGDFELPNFPQLNAVGVGNPSILGWTVTDGTVDVSGGVNTLYGWAPYTGNHSLDLNGVNAGTIQASRPAVCETAYMYPKSTLLVNWTSVCQGLTIAYTGSHFFS